MFSLVGSYYIIRCGVDIKEMIIIIECWAPIKGYEGWYEVSNAGNVRSVERVVTYKDGRKRTYPSVILKTRLHNGYKMVNLNKNKKCKEAYVHRLVAEAFKLKPKNKPWVNHKNGIKLDCSSANLEWCTPSYNNEHAVKTGLRNDNVSGLLKHNDSMKKSVMAIINGKQVIKPCAKDMAKYLIKHGITSVDVDKARGSIKHSCLTGKLYKNIEFKYV